MNASELLIAGMMMGIPVGIFIDRLILKATLVPWLMRHGRR